MVADKCEILVINKDAICSTDTGLNKCNEVGKTYNVQYNDAASLDEFLANCHPGGKFEGVKALAFSGHPSLSKVDADTIKKLPPSIKFIASKGAGYDKIDVQAALQKGIQVAHTPSAVDNATATTAMHLIVSSLRRYSQGEAQARRGNFDAGFGLAHDPEEKLLGIVGMGNIGRKLARRALAYDMKIIYYNRSPVDPSVLRAEGLEGKVEYVSNLDDLVKQSDVISLHMPLTEKTRGLFGAKYFDMMKPSAVLVNTARGPVVDEAAMIKALKEGKIGGAGLDVFEAEPEIPEELLKNERIALLPHLGTATVETRGKMEVMVFDNIIAGLEKGRVVNLVAEQQGKL